MAAGVCGSAGLTAARTNAIPSALFPPYWYELKVTSRPWEVGTLVLAKTPPSWVVVAGVRRSLPEPCASVAVVQLATGLAVAFPAALRHAALVPVGAVGRDNEPAVPSTVLSWNGWLNSTVPVAAFAAGTPTTIMPAPANSEIAKARDMIPLIDRRSAISVPSCLRFVGFMIPVDCAVYARRNYRDHG